MDYEAKKREVLTTYFNTRLKSLQLKIRNICFRNYISDASKICEDILAEVLLALSKYNAQKLVEAYQSNPKSIEAIAVQIAKRCFRVRKDNPDNPNNSPGTKLLYASTFRDFQYIDPLEVYDEDNTSNRAFILFDKDETDMPFDLARWERIKTRLTAKEIAFVEDILDGVRLFKRKPTNEYLIYRAYIYAKIKSIDLTQPLSPLEQIRTRLDMLDVIKFDVMFNEDLSFKEKIKLLKYKEGQYISQRRILLKKIKMMNVK